MQLHYIDQQCPHSVLQIYLHPLYMKTVATSALGMHGRIWRRLTRNRHHFGSFSLELEVLCPGVGCGGAAESIWSNIPAKYSGLGTLGWRFPAWLGKVILWGMVSFLHTKRNQPQIVIYIQPAWVKSLLYFQNKLVHSGEKSSSLHTRVRVCVCVCVCVY